jgi:hypothetical protein
MRFTSLPGNELATRLANQLALSGNAKLPNLKARIATGVQCGCLKVGRGERMIR